MLPAICPLLITKHHWRGKELEMKKKNGVKKIGGTKSHQMYFYQVGQVVLMLFGSQERTLFSNKLIFAEENLANPFSTILSETAQLFHLQFFIQFSLPPITSVTPTQNQDQEHPAVCTHQRGLGRCGRDDPRLQLLVLFRLWQVPREFHPMAGLGLCYCTPDCCT